MERWSDLQMFQCYPMHALLNNMLNDSIPQGSMPAPLLYNLYTHDLSTSISINFIYADDIVIATQHKSIMQSEPILLSYLNTSIYGGYTLVINVLTLTRTRQK